MQELLETELREELQSYGIDPDKGRLNEEQYDTATKELANRQAAAAADTGPETAEKVQGLRDILAWHLHKVGAEAAHSVNLALLSLCNLNKAGWCVQQRGTASNEVAFRSADRLRAHAAKVLCMTEDGLAGL